MDCSLGSGWGCPNVRRLQSRMSHESRMSPQSRMSHESPMPPEPLVTPKSRFRVGKGPNHTLGIEPATRHKAVCETAVPTELWPDSSLGGRLSHPAQSPGVIWALSPPGNEIQAPKTAQTHPNLPKPTHSPCQSLVQVLRLLLYYSC